MSDVFNSIPLTGLAASLAACMGIRPPQKAGEAIASLCDLAKHKCDGRPIERVLLYHPDCIGQWLYQKYTMDFTPVFKHVQLALPLLTVDFPKTPMCFATMYSGAPPEVHGIRKYEKPVLTIDTLFDALVRSGKRAAIVAVQESSMSKIFAGRDIDYYILPNDDAVSDKALELIQRNEHDFLSVYNQEYDSRMHKIDPESQYALEAMNNHITTFSRLSEAVERCWAGHDTLIGFAPDHGNHRCAEGNGEHGENIPEDLNIMHFYGVKPK